MYFSVPPSRIEIFSEHGIPASNSILGPYKEGSSVNITCMSSGGKCLVVGLKDIFSHTITPSSPVHFICNFYEQST